MKRGWHINSATPVEVVDLVEESARSLLRLPKTVYWIGKFDRDSGGYIFPRLKRDRASEGGRLKAHKLLTTVTAWPDRLVGIFRECEIAADQARQTVDDLVESFRDLFSEDRLTEHQHGNLICRCTDSFHAFHKLAETVRGRQSVHKAPTTNTADKSKPLASLDSPTDKSPKAVHEPSSDESKGTADGPLKPDGFRLNGHEVSGLAETWLTVMTFVWTRRENPPKLSEVMAIVHERNRADLDKLLDRIRNKLRAEKWPETLEVFNGCVMLRKPARKRKSNPAQPSVMKAHAKPNRSKEAKLGRSSATKPEKVVTKRRETRGGKK